MTNELYRNLIIITEDYLGPAAERFVTRQISFHLQKPPQELASEDLPKLVEWSKVAMGLLTHDRRVVEEYAERINRL